MPEKPCSYKKSTINLLLIAIFVCTLFGNGTHFHSVFEHFADHGDIHAYVHAHPVDSMSGDNPEFDDKNTHQHPAATVDLTATRAEKTFHKAFNIMNVFSATGELPGLHALKNQNPRLLDLPPPLLLNSPAHFSSLSLRGPPRG